MRRKVTALVLALALVAALPCRASAETPIEFYNNLAGALGISLDVQTQAWLDKSKSAYLSYIEQNVSHTLTSPNAIYSAGYQLESLTGLDVVYVQDGGLYLNAAPDGAGGAMYGVLVSWGNYSALLNELMRWVRLAVNEGPAWPNVSDGGTSVGGGTAEGPISSPVLLSKVSTDNYTISETKPSAPLAFSLVLSESQLEYINNRITGKQYVFIEIISLDE